MCLCTDAVSPEFYVETTPRARKNHRCEECGDLIFVGTRYQRVAGRWDQEVYSLSFCTFCWEWREALVKAEKEKEPVDPCLPPFGELWSCIEMFTEEHLGYHPRRTEAGSKEKLVSDR